MLTIGQISNLAKISNRTMRHYESLGLLKPIQRGNNNYRYYKRDVLAVLDRIRDLQSLGFKLDEIRQILPVKPEDIYSWLSGKLAQVDQEFALLGVRRQRLEHLLSTLKPGVQNRPLNQDERKMLMETVKEHAIVGLKKKKCIDVSHSRLLEREVSNYDGDDQRKFFDAIRSCVEFARSRDLILGPGRGYASSSMLLFGLGLTAIDPVADQLVPERMVAQPPEIHIDVEYQRGQQFVDFCRKITDGLSWGAIHAFKMPVIDIVSRVLGEIGKTWDEIRIATDDERILKMIQTGDIEKIFLFDKSPTALVMKYENHLPEYVGTAKIKEYLRSQEIHSFRDALNILAIWRPDSPEKIARIERYREAKSKDWCYEFLTAKQREILEPNFGLIIYHEDVIRLIAAGTGWDFGRCAKLRRELFFRTQSDDFESFKRLVSPEVAALLVEESPFTFCKSHLLAHGRFTEITAYLKAYHREIYLSEVERWEASNGLMYDDIGIRIKGVSLLQN